MLAYTALTLVSFYVNVRAPWRTVIPRWQRAALDLADLNLVKEGSDLKKERAGRKSSFSSGLLTSGNLSPVDSARSAIRRGRVIARDLCQPPRSSCYIFTGGRFNKVGSGSWSGKFEVREEFDLITNFHQHGASCMILRFFMRDTRRQNRGYANLLLLRAPRFSLLWFLFDKRAWIVTNRMANFGRLKGEKNRNEQLNPLLNKVKHIFYFHFFNTP